MSKLRVFMTPGLAQADPANGIGRIIRAQYRYLPELGIEFVADDARADVVAVHAGTQITERVDVLHCHGLYWTGDRDGRTYLNWHHAANRKIVDSARKARAITVPSDWVGECFRRDMRVDPQVIGHGLDVAEWEPGENGGYLLWNKARAGDVCDPVPAYECARRGLPVTSTFAPNGFPILENLHVIGALDFQAMKAVVQNADIYLATTQETFGIGTLEAMAAGVPVLGFNWGGTAEIVQHQVAGYLVEPGDYDGLLAGYHWLKAHRAEVSANARACARIYDWPRVIGQYADLYRRCLGTDPDGLAVVITNHNYSQWVGEAIDSALNQTQAPAEVIVVDDGSTDASRDVIASYGDRIRMIFQENQGVAAARNHGIEATQKPFIVCLDADDRLDPTYVQTVRSALAADRSLGVAYTGLKLLHTDGSTTACDFPPEFDWVSQATPHVPPSNRVPCAAGFRRAMWERAGGFKQIYAPGEDAEFWTRGLAVGFTARKVCKEALFSYRVHGGSASRILRYKPVDTWHPWMRDHLWPMAAPMPGAPLVRSYSSPLVSVIIPVGPGHARYLPAALDSLLGQTCRDWEAIVINDSGAPLENLTAYPFIRRIDTLGKEGAGAARNYGLDMTHAPFVLFLDADDYLLPDALEHLLRAAVTGRYVFGDYLALKADGAIERMYVRDYDRGAYLTEQQIHAVTALLPTAWAKEIGGFDATLPGWEEYDFYMRLAIRGRCGLHIPEPVIGYRLATGTRRNLSHQSERELKQIFRNRYPMEVSMSGCCGGNADALIAAKHFIERGQAVPTATAPLAAPDTGLVRVEFIGDWMGPVPFRANGRVWYGARMPEYRYQDVPPEDAEILVATGKFQRVVFAPKTEAVTPLAQEPETIQPTVIDPPAPAPVPEKPVKRGRK